MTTHGPLPRAGTPVPVGPFVVLGAMRQSGSITVSNAVADLHLEFQPHGDLARREVKEEDRQRDPFLTAEFQYLNMPPVDRPQGTTGPASLSWLDVSGETMKGQVRTRVTHALDLVPDGPGGLVWRVLTRVEATPKWTDPDTLKVQIPPDCDFNEESVASYPERKVRHIDYDRASRVVQLKLTPPDESSLKPFWVKLEGRTPASRLRILRFIRNPQSAIRNRCASGWAVLALPRPVGVVDQGGKVTVHVPDDLELVMPETDPPALQMSRQAPHDQTWRSQRVPEQVEVAWRPYRPDMRVTSVVDLDLASRQGHVRQKLLYQFTQAAPAQVALLVPEAAADSLAIDKGGKLMPPSHPGVGSANHLGPESLAGRTSGW